MAHLVPCSSCGRHVRLTDTSCPFCETRLDSASLSEQYAPRRKAVQSGIKRAAMFALGASMAAACGDDGEDPQPSPDASVQPVYGAPITDTGSEGASSSDTATDEDSTSEPTAQPLYGAPVLDASFTTDGSEGGPVDAGAPDADLLDAEVTSGVDVTSGAAPDASATSGDGPDGAVIGWDMSDTGPLIQPLYGAPFRN